MLLIKKTVFRTIHEIAVPANAVADGYLGVVFENTPLNDTVVIFPIEDGLEILYKADSFGANFIRATLLIFMRLVFLAALGISVATWLSFPVAILLCLGRIFLCVNQRIHNRIVRQSWAAALAVSITLRYGLCWDFCRSLTNSIHQRL